MSEQYRQDCLNTSVSVLESTVCTAEICPYEMCTSLREWMHCLCKHDTRQIESNKLKLGIISYKMSVLLKKQNDDLMTIYAVHTCSCYLHILLPIMN